MSAKIGDNFHAAGARNREQSGIYYSDKKESRVAGGENQFSTSRLESTRFVLIYASLSTP
jgi:hypothetical protein